MTALLANPGARSLSQAPTPLTHRQRMRVWGLGGVQVAPDRILIPRTGANGFDILLWRCGSEVTGDFGGLVEDFSDLDEALNWAERCHNEEYRLRVEFAGRRPFRWALERMLPNGGLIRIFEVGYPLLLRRLLPRSVRYFENARRTRAAAADAPGPES